MARILLAEEMRTEDGEQSAAGHGRWLRSNPMSHQLVVVAVGLVAAALMIAGTAAAQTVAVEVTDTWARATPGKAENGAAYLTLESPAADRLTGVSTPVAKKAELHTMTTEGGVMKMRPLAGVDLPAGQKVTLKPGAAHIMLLGLKEPLRPGQSFPLTLNFEKAGASEVTVTVEKAGAGIRMPMTQPMQMPMPAGR
jgi:copper(I)-binding protein